MVEVGDPLQFSSPLFIQGQKRAPEVRRRSLRCGLQDMPEESRQRQRAWRKRQRTYSKWITSLRAGGDRTGLSIAQQFRALVRKVEVKDRWGIVEEHLVPLRRRQRIRICGRRVGMVTAAWMLFRGPVDARYTAVAACGVPNCCSVDHLVLQWRGTSNAEHGKASAAWQSELGKAERL